VGADGKIQSRMRVKAYEEQSIRTSLELQRLGHENHILHQGRFCIREKDQVLQSLYYHLSKVEHGLNHTRPQLLLPREEVDTRTYAIVHLENTVEQQDVELEEREEQIADLLH
jgi:hypothetical protein